ncbi:DUF4215 domain-containing protein [Myxococcota bacterium]
MARAPVCRLWHTRVNRPAGAGEGSDVLRLMWPSLLVMGLACCSRQPNVLLLVADPNDLAAEATAVLIGPALEGRERTSLSGKKFTLRVLVTAERTGEELLWVDAVDSRDKPLGRGRVRVMFARGSNNSATVELAAPCEHRVNDGERCAMAGGSGNIGVCADGRCGESICGDGFVDTARGEACDDQNDDPNDGCDQCGETTWEVTVVAGEVGVRGDPLLMDMLPSAVAFDVLGNLFIADTRQGVVLELSPDYQEALIVAGGETKEYVAIGVPSALQLDKVSSLAVDGLGTLYLADARNHRIIRVDPGAGSANSILGGLLDTPLGVAVDGDGNVYVADWGNARVLRRSGQGGAVDTLVSGLLAPVGIAVNVAGDRVLILDENVDVDAGHATMLLYRYSVTDDDLQLLVSWAVSFDPLPPGLGSGPNPGIGAPKGLSVDAQENVYIAGAFSNQVRVYDASGVGELRVIAGTTTPGFAGDGEPAVAAQLFAPLDVAVGPDGSLAVADFFNGRVRAIDGSGQINTVAGRTSIGAIDEGSLATTVALPADWQTPWLEGLAITPDRDLLLVVSAGHMVRRVDASTGAITTVAGNGRPCGTESSGSSVDGAMCGDNQGAAAATLHSPIDVEVDSHGNVFVSERGASRIRWIDTNGHIHSAYQAPTPMVAGPTGLGIDRDDRLYVLAEGTLWVMDAPTSPNAPMAASQQIFGSHGDLAIDPVEEPPVAYVADADNHVVLWVDVASGQATVFAGDGSACPDPLDLCGDDGPATSAQLSSPSGVTVGADQTVYIADTSLARVRMVDADGTISTLAGTGEPGFGGDGGPAAEARIGYPVGLVIAGSDLFVGTTRMSSSPLAHLVRHIDLSTPDRIITTYVGPVNAPGDGPLATSFLISPWSVVVGEANDERVLFVADAGASRVRMVSADYVSSIVGYPHDQPSDPRQPWPARYVGRLRDVVGLAFDATSSTLFFSELYGHVIRRVDLSSDPWMAQSYAGVVGEEGARDGSVDECRFHMPGGLALDSVNQWLYVTDVANHVVRRIDLSRDSVETVAGVMGFKGNHGDGVLATEALLNNPRGVALAPDGGFYITDGYNHRVRRVDANNMMTTILGDGTPATVIDSEPANLTPVDTPTGLATDSRGNLFVTSRTSIRLLPADHQDASGARVVTGAGRVLTIYGAPPRHSFPQSVTVCVAGLAVDPEDDGRVYFVDGCAGILVRLDRRVE